jgi:ribosomal protein L31E
MSEIHKLSKEELKAQLAEIEKQEREEQAAKRAAYEKQVNDFVIKMASKSKQVHEVMAAFKKECFEGMEEQRGLLEEYAGGLRKNSKGGFGLRSADGNYQIRLDRNLNYEYDERATQAIDLIREFMESMVKKKSIEAYSMVMQLLSRNVKGDLEPSRVLDLLKMEHKWEDERWSRAMELLKESHQAREVAYNISFTEKDSTGKDQCISLSFAGIKIKDYEATEIPQ